MVGSRALNRFEAIGSTDSLNPARGHEMQLTRGVKEEPILAVDAHLGAFRIQFCDQQDTARIEPCGTASITTRGRGRCSMLCHMAIK